MSQFPMILLPSAIAQVQSELPPVPQLPAPEPPSEPIPPPPLPPVPKRVEQDVVNTVGFLSAIAALVIVVIAFLQSANAGVSALLLSGLGVTGAIGLTMRQQIQSFPQRLEQHRLKVAKHDEDELSYQQQKRELPERRRQYQIAVTAHRQECDRLEQEYRSPEKVAEFRRYRCLQITKQTLTYDGKNSTARIGASEAELVKVLKRYFPGRIHTRLTLVVPGYNYPYSPDIVYIDSETGLHIDIEVDEPYAYQSGEPIHYIGKDDRRNEFFLRRNWIVIRFSEQQVVCAPESCCKAVAQEIAKVTGHQKLLVQFKHIKDLQTTPQWTYEEAEKMALAGIRDRYLCS